MKNIQPYRLILRIIIKAILLLIAINFSFLLFRDIPIGRISLYNFVISGRLRLPFGENPENSYNLTMNNLDAMIASHEINKIKPKEEFNVVILGDSSVWGFLQENENSLAGILNSKDDLSCNDLKIRFYNLGYPSLSVFKDLMILDSTLDYETDLILWFLTLESLPKSDQLETPLVSNNPRIANQIIRDYSLGFEQLEDEFQDYTLWGRGREIADILHLQLYGIPWSATGIDQDIPNDFTPAMRDFESDEVYKTFFPGELNASDLGFDILKKASDAISNEIIFINEPILISKGENSQIRYNFYYPRWAFDDFRRLAANFMQENGLEYYDFWDIVPESEFTNSAIHLSYIGETILASKIRNILVDHCQNNTF